MADPAASRPSQAPVHRVKHVCFRLHGQELAVDIAAVKETGAMRPITRVFLAPRHIAGIMNLRGDIVPVLDLAQFLGLPPTPTLATTRVVVCRHPAADAQDLVAGILVDELADLRLLDMERIQPPPPTLSESAAMLLRGVSATADGPPLQVLDVARLLELERSRALRREAS